MQRKVSKPWFAAKPFGYGTGMPIAWQGWLVLLLYLAVVGVAPLFAMIAPGPPMSLVLMVAVPVAATAVMLVICARKTDGGWRWRGKP